MRLPKSQVSTAKQPTLAQVDKALTVIAASIILNKKLFLSEDTLETESRRLERCVEEYYVKEKHEMQFLEFAANFLKENYKELVFGSQFDGDYLDNIKDPNEETIDPTEYSVIL